MEVLFFAFFSAANIICLGLILLSLRHTLLLVFFLLLFGDLLSLLLFLSHFDLIILGRLHSELLPEAFFTFDKVRVLLDLRASLFPNNYLVSFLTVY